MPNISRKKTVLWIIFLLQITFVSYAQDVNDYINRCQYQQAIAYIEQQNDTSKVAAMQKIACYTYLQNYYKAVEDLQLLQESYPDDVQIKTELALTYKKASMYQKSMDYFDELIQIDSTNTYFKIQKADVLFQLAQYDLALVEYKAAYDECGALNLLKQSAFCFEKMNQTDSAKYYYEYVWKMDSTDQNAMAKLIKINIDEQNFETALDYSESFIAKDTSNMQINFLNAFCHYELNDYLSAIERFEKCYAAGDTSRIVNSSLGTSYYFMNDYENALHYFNLAYRQDTTNNNVLYGLAQANSKLNNSAEAILCYEKLIQRTLSAITSMYVYHKGLADIYYLDENYEFAIENYKQALHYATPTQSVNVLSALAEIYDIRQENYPTAINYYRLYKESLVNYRQYAEIEKDSSNIRHISARINYVDKHLRYLEEKIKPENQ